MKTLRMIAVLSALVGCAPNLVSRQAPPVPAQSLADAGRQAEQRGDFVRAEQYYSAALAGGADQTALTRELIRVCVRGGRFRSALSYAEAELAVHPRDVALRQLVGGIHLSLGDLVRAEAELLQALRVAEDSALAHYTLALVMRRDSQRSAEARVHFQRYLELAPAGPHAEHAAHALAE